MPHVDVHFLKRSLLGGERDCGDTGVIVQRENECFMALVDVLGHGEEAYLVSERARDFFEENNQAPLPDLMQGLHKHLQGTRGAVAALCRLDTQTGELHYTGIGNITVRVLGTQTLRFVLKDGVVGYMMGAAHDKTARLYSGDVLLMYSDGIKEHFELFDCPGLLTGGAEDVAQTLMEHFGKQEDDASCIVMRYGV